jgi:hypothetical protein
MQHAGPHMASWVFLLLIPLIIWVRLARARRAARASDFWFEPEGDHFIYHPFGRFGAAYLVSPMAREAIRARMAMFARIVAGVLVSVAVALLVLRSTDPDMYARWTSVIMRLRLSLVLMLICGSVLWRVMALRPLYAGAPPAPRRISPQSIRAKQAASRSWFGLLLSCTIWVCAAGLLAHVARATGSAQYLAAAAVISILALLNLRGLVTKWQHRHG